MINKIKINNQDVGLHHKPYIVAELSANHNGSIERAFKTIEYAAACGADAIKLQTYTADTMTINSKKEEFQIREGPWKGFNLYDLYKWAQTPFEWQKQLFQKAKDVGITVFSTPFDESAVDLLEELNSPAYKVASFEMTDLPLIRRMAKTGKPLIVSTGMATLEEISETIQVIEESGNTNYIVLHCVSSYPSPIDQANLATISDLRKRFGCLVGLSDHTLGITAPITSISLGACFIEKHFTLDRRDKGPDSDFSIEPQELKQLCQSTKEAWQAIGNAGYERKPAEKASLKFRRSIYFVNELKAGETIKEGDIRRIRPGYGLAPKFFDQLIGKKVKKDVSYGTATSWELIDYEK